MICVRVSMEVYCRQACFLSSSLVFTFLLLESFFSILILDSCNFEFCIYKKIKHESIFFKIFTIHFILFYLIFKAPIYLTNELSGTIRSAYL